MAALLKALRLLQFSCAALALGASAAVRAQDATLDSDSLAQLEIAHAACSGYATFPVSTFPTGTFDPKVHFSEDKNFLEKSYEKVANAVSSSSLEQVAMNGWQEIPRSLASWSAPLFDLQLQWNRESGGKAESRLLERESNSEKIQLAALVSHGGYGFPLSEVTCMVFIPNILLPTQEKISDWRGKPAIAKPFEACEDTEAELATNLPVLAGSGLDICEPHESSADRNYSHFFAWVNEETEDISVAIVPADRTGFQEQSGLYYYARFVNIWAPLPPSNESFSDTK
jgi:hypothetical protein